MIDSAYGQRMELLVELMQISPNKPMKKLQWEALKFYPLYYKESIRWWMGWRIAARAADILNKREGLYDQLRQSGNRRSREPGKGFSSP